MNSNDLIQMNIILATYLLTGYFLYCYLARRKFEQVRMEFNW